MLFRMRFDAKQVVWSILSPQGQCSQGHSDACEVEYVLFTYRVIGRPHRDEKSKGPESSLGIAMRAARTSHTPSLSTTGARVDLGDAGVVLWAVQDVNGKAHAQPCFGTRSCEAGRASIYLKGDTPYTRR